MALARLGAMAQERGSLMTKLHRNLLEPQRLQVKEEHDGCCCATCHARCFWLSLLPQLVGGRGAVMAAPRATSSHGDNLTAWPRESNDFWARSFGNLAGMVNSCLPVGWLAIPRRPGSFDVPVPVHPHVVRNVTSVLGNRVVKFLLHPL